jgi:hypothetical protein
MIACESEHARCWKRITRQNTQHGGETFRRLEGKLAVAKRSEHGILSHKVAQALPFSPKELGSRLIWFGIGIAGGGFSSYHDDSV